MSSQPQRSRPQHIERFVTQLAEDVHSAVGGRVFPAKLVQTAVTVLSNDKAVSSEKWERVWQRAWLLFHTLLSHSATACPFAGCADSQNRSVCSKRSQASAKNGRAGH